MKITFNQDPKVLFKRIENDIDAFTSGLVEGLATSIEKGARRNFNNARGLISSDFDYVDVRRSVNGKHSQTITCIGDQVLFIEFGAGAQNATRYSVGEVTGWHGEHISWRYVERPNFGFTIKHNTLIEEAPRPSGIVPLGHYGKGHGMDDNWIRPSVTGIPNTHIGESHVHKRNGDVRRDVVWTKGHPPMRALWRAVRSAERSLQKRLGGK